MKTIFIIFVTIFAQLVKTQNLRTTIYTKFQADENEGWSKALPEEWARADIAQEYLEKLTEPGYEKILAYQKKELIRDDDLDKEFKDWKDKLHLQVLKPQGNVPQIYVMQSHENVGNSNKKAMIHIHGGNGFMGTGLDNMKLFDPIAHKTNTVIFSPRYRLSPTYKIPVQQQDVIEAIQYVYYNANKFGVNKDKIILTGDSAGCNIAIGASMLLHQTDYIKMMILFQPMVNDYLFSKPRPNASKGEQLLGLVVEKSFELLSNDFKQEQNLPILFPGKMKLAFAKLIPPTVLMTSEYDLFRRDTYDFKRLLIEAGNLLDFGDYQKVGHNAYAILPQDNEIVQQIYADWVKLIKTMD